MAALRALGVSVWHDERDIDDFASITRAVRDGLSSSKALVAYYSETYPTRRACQWELTAAFLAGQAEGDPRGRILVVNPEDHAEHILPLQLHDALFDRLPVDSSDAQVEATADRIRAAALRLTSRLSEVGAAVGSQWHGGKGLGSNRFIGRVSQFWALHSVLFEDDAVGVSETKSWGYAQVIGIGGVGKSLFAEEYALRFGKAFPGGVFVLNGLGDLDSQIANFAAGFGLDFPSSAPGDSLAKPDPRKTYGWLRSWLAKQGTYLWLVDDPPPSDDEGSRRRWFAPTLQGKTLFTTRSRQHLSTGGLVDLAALHHDEAYHLLTVRRTPSGSLEESAARELVAELGAHPLAVDVAGGALAQLIGRESFATFLAKIRDRERDALSDAANLLPDLPNGHERSIARTLGTSIELLQESGRDFLRLSTFLPSFVISFDLVDAIFADGVSHWSAAIGAKGAVENSLADLNSDGYSIHALVARAMRHFDERLSPEDDGAADRNGGLRRRAVIALADLLKEVDDIHEHQRLSAHVVHARHLAVAPQSLEDAALLCLVAHYDAVHGDRTRTRQMWASIADIRRRLLPKDDLETLVSETNLAMAADNELDLALGFESLERVLGVLRLRYPEKIAEALTVKANIATILVLQARFQDAGALLTELVVERENLHGGDASSTLTTKANLAGVLFRLGDIERALELQEAVYVSRRQRLGDTNAETLSAAQNLATFLDAHGSIVRAVQLQEATAEAIKNIYGVEHSATVFAREQLRTILLKGGYHAAALSSAMNPDEARVIQEVLGEVAERLFGPEDLEALRIKHSLALTLHRLGDVDAAWEMLEVTVATASRTLGEPHLETIQFRKNRRVSA